LDRRELTLEHVLREAAGGEVVFLTASGEARFALVAVDEADREVFALRSNPEFLAYLDACRERAKAGPRKSLREMRESCGAGATGPDSAQETP
jgi:antitoxin (DNA-binding transcriptional repressor) of toxin-antitoxin stability system